MRIEQDIKLDYKDVLIRPKRSKLLSRSQVSLERPYKFLNSGQTYMGIPVIAANMDTIGTMDMARALTKHHLMTSLHKHYEINDLVKFWETRSEAGTYYSNTCFYTIGMSKKDVDKLDEFIKADKAYHKSDYPLIPYLCIDVANGYNEEFVEFVNMMRKKLPDTTIMAGNVVTGEMVEQLILAGADIVKVGIGPGSVCTTRAVTGVGYPQLSAIIECADAAHGLGGHVCADGGCQIPGDVAKAFGAGADFVMLGGMLAGHDQCNGELSTDEVGNQTMKFYGMSSEAAMEKYSGGVAHYRASEGKVVQAPYRGNVEDTISEILGGLRSTCTYVGAVTLKELSKRTTFVRVTQQLNPKFA